MLQERDVFRLLGSFIASEVQRQMQPVLTALDTAQKQISLYEKRFEDLAKLNKGSQIDYTLVNQHINASINMYVPDMIDEAIKELPKAEKGEKGDQGEPGKQLEIPWDFLNEQLQAGMQMLSDQLAKKIEALPKPERGEKGEPGKDGKDGINGTDGADGKNLELDTVHACLSQLVFEAVRSLPVPVSVVSGLIDRDGHLCLTHSDGTTRGLGKVVGKDGEPGPPGKDGVDGLGIEDIQWDGERTMRIANEKVSRDIVFSHPLYQGLWKARAYVRGDEVTSDGSQWIAMRDTDKEPGTLDSGWRLACKRGRAGKNGKGGSE